MLSSYKVDMLSLGDELLLGIRENAHLHWLGGQLCHHGLSIRRAHVLRDDGAEIGRFFSESWEDADVVITTGGLGPTDDDLTRETIAACLERKLVHHRPSEDALRERFQRLNRTPTANNLKQCYIIEGAEAIPNRNGTAPGQWYQQGGKILVMLPGPTNELRPMWTDQVLPRLKEAGVAMESFPYLQIRTCGIGESNLEVRCKPLFARYPGRLQVAYCAHAGMVDLRLSSVGHSLSTAEIQALGEEIRELLADDFVCYGECCMASHIIGKLRVLEQTLAVAESCTGGLLSSAFTDVPGASKAFLGGVVCYTNDVKEQLLDVPDCLLQQHGAVSEECAVAMAIGAAEHFGSDYALSVTGFAGPGGGTESHPVGTVFVGLHTPAGSWAHRAVYPGSRLQVKQRAVNLALDWMRRKMNAYQAADVLDKMCREID